MFNRNSLPPIDIASVIPEEDLEAGLLERAFNTVADWHRNDVVEGIVRKVDSDGVVVDIGYKSEGIVSLEEWREDGCDIALPGVGDRIQVLIEAEENDNGLIQVSFRKALLQKAWKAFLAKHKERDVVSGEIRSEIKGGLLVDIGVDAFLPASQVDIRRPTNLSDFVGKTIECHILQIDAVRRKVVVSRRKAIETGDPMFSPSILDRFFNGQICKGVVKNIAEFGAFVDLGGFDGLLHITDMSWARVANPHDFVKIDQVLEVFVISVDREKCKISLGLKQLTPDPWRNIESNYAVGSRHRGKVIALPAYGAFIELGPAIVGLLHVSEMALAPMNDSKGRFSIGQEVDVRILLVNPEKREISLRMAQDCETTHDRKEQAAEQR